MEPEVRGCGPELSLVEGGAGELAVWLEGSVFWWGAWHLGRSQLGMLMDCDVVEVRWGGCEGEGPGLGSMRM